MNGKFTGYFLLSILTVCGCASTITVRKNPTVDFSLKDNSAVVALLPCRNFSDHKEIDLPYLEGMLLDKLRSEFDDGRFVSIQQLKKKILTEQDKEVVSKVITDFEKSGMLRAENVQAANRILKAGYFIASSFGAGIGVGYSAEWVFTISMQIYDAKTGKTVFSVTAEETEDSVEGFDLQESSFFESVVDDALGAIP